MFRAGGKPDEAELKEAKELAKKSVWFQAKLFMGTIFVLRLGINATHMTNKLMQQVLNRVMMVN